MLSRKRLVVFIIMINLYYGVIPEIAKKTADHRILSSGIVFFLWKNCVFLEFRVDSIVKVVHNDAFYTLVTFLLFLPVYKLFGSF